MNKIVLILSIIFSFNVFSAPTQVITLVPKSDSTPTLSKSYDKSSTQMNEYILKNPLCKNIVANIDCGAEFENLNIKVNSKDSMKLYIQPFNVNIFCTMINYKIIK